MPRAPKGRPTERLFGDSQPVTEDEGDGFFIEPQKRPPIAKEVPVAKPVLSDDETADADDEQDIEGMNVDDAGTTTTDTPRKRKKADKVSDTPSHHSLISLLHNADPDYQFDPSPSPSKKKPKTNSTPTVSTPDSASKPSKKGTLGVQITGLKNKMNDVKKKYLKAKDNEDRDTKKIEKLKQRIKKYCERGDTQRANILMDARDIISKQLVKDFFPRESWEQETYEVNLNGEVVQRYALNDVAELMRSVANLIDPVNQSAELLKNLMEEHKVELRKLLKQQSDQLDDDYDLD